MNRIYNATFNNTTYSFEADTDKDNICVNVLQNKLEELVRKSGLTTPRKEPKTISVKLTVLKVDNGILVEKPVKVYQIQPPLTRMNEQEFAEEQVAILKDIPDELVMPFRQWAWEHGHSSGYEEVICILRNMVDEFQPSIDQLIRRLS